ncbi:MBL fold metallo-hydrolase [Sulfuriflexus mobilis]|uniref:MBL fold metallo-hydrolase n=1 Tax=Sulfuriflexus mobilis TaxID=1811807 RepID=UPI000F818F60|nr:MBL fold metallo-hydrolase [Sulfuriflexus mobilis]
MKTIGTFSIGIFALLLVACEPASKTQQAKQPPGAELKIVTHPDYPMQARQVAEGVYAVITPARDFPNAENKGWNSNSGFVVTAEGVLVVDTGSSEKIGAALRETIRTVTDKPVKWVVNTHGHGDHWLGTHAFIGEGAEVIASDTVAGRIENEGEYWVNLFNSMTEGAIGQPQTVVPATRVTGHMKRRLGGLEVELLPSGSSHSPGDVLVWLPGKKVLIAGDVVYTDRAPATFDGKVKQWIAFLTELEAMPVEVVIPGHGNVGSKADITRQRDYLAAIWASVSAGFEEERQAFEIIPQARANTAQFAEFYPGYEKNLPESVSHVYLQVEAAAF